MGLFFNRSTKSKVAGDIAYYGLTEWWLNELTEAERNTIRNTFKPIMRERLIDEGHIESSSQSKLAFLGVLAEWFKKKEYYHIAKKILNEGEKIYSQNKNALDLHYFCLSAIRVYYANREGDEDALNRAIEYCERQISIAPKVKKALKKEYPSNSLPCHTGYQQLAIIYEMQKLYGKALHIAYEAQEQGWNVEDCAKRIERLDKKLEKEGSKNLIGKKNKAHDSASSQKTRDVLASADEIRKYKQLMDEGIITAEQFEKKKNQLLGM